MVTAEVEVCYDPKIHITAGELRKLGFLIPETLADVAYVRRVAVGLAGNERLNQRTCMLRLMVLEQFMVPPEYCELTYPGALS